MHEVKFSYTTPLGDRRHYINENDVSVLLNRLPYETWQRLKVVHFNDQSRGGRTLGYTTRRGRREISICALPPRVSLKWARSAGDPEHYGAIKGTQWPTLAVRRYQLYYTFLHEIGHLQIILPSKTNPNRKFASETKAHLFANFWRKTLWNDFFDHPDPIHNAPTKDELSILKANWINAHLLYKKGLDVDIADKADKAIPFYRQAIELYPEHTQALEGLGVLTYLKNKEDGNIEELKQAEGWLSYALSLDPLLPQAGKYLKRIQRILNQYSEIVAAAENGQLERVKELIDRGADIDDRDQDGCTALQLAFAGGYEDVIEMLIRRRADVTILDKDGFCLLHWAVFSGKITLLSRAYELDDDINRLDKKGRTPLSWMSSEHWAEGAKWLLTKGADVNCQDFSGWTPLHYAANRGANEVTTVLLALGAEPSAVDRRGRTSADVASDDTIRDLLRTAYAKR
jgi:ankyrin repeat protein